MRRQAARGGEVKQMVARHCKALRAEATSGIINSGSGQPLDFFAWLAMRR